MNHNKGIHHITAIAGDPQRNLSFYTRTLGMRLVKKTVNFDDPSVYHFYFADATGTPGTVLTFFPWKNAVKGSPDRGQVVAVSFAVPSDSRSFWIDHLDDQNVDYEPSFIRFGRERIGLQDPDGLHLELVFDESADGVEGWEGGSVPDEHAIRGFHGATLAVEDHEPTAQPLKQYLGFEKSGQEENRHLFETEALFGSKIEIIDGSELQGRMGRGTVHHIAFRAEDSQEQHEIQSNLNAEGYHVTEIKDRQYFQSIYFHEPGGVLFEVATDGPGFTIDEAPAELGNELQLPPWLEKRRNQIAQQLPDVR